jgi:hypothetical protein
LAPESSNSSEEKKMNCSTSVIVLKYPLTDNALAYKTVRRSSYNIHLEITWKSSSTWVGQNVQYLSFARMRSYLPVSKRIHTKTFKISYHNTYNTNPIRLTHRCILYTHWSETTSAEREYGRMGIWPNEQTILNSILITTNY